jgi:hypothetical protein
LDFRPGQCRANANVNINENKPSDAREFWLIIIENNMALTLYGPQYTEVFAGLDKDNLI